MRHEELADKAREGVGARSEATLLTLVALALVLPATYNNPVGAIKPTAHEFGLNRIFVLKGMQLLAVYLILGITFFFAPSFSAP